MGFAFFAIILSLFEIVLRQDLQRLFIFSLDLHSIFSDCIKHSIVYTQTELTFLSLAYKKHKLSL